MSQIVSLSALRQLVDAWIAHGRRVIGPSRIKPDLVLYKALAGGDELLLEGFIRPANSAKETVFPRHERLFGFRQNGKNIELVPAEPDAVEQIVLAARPCDAAAFDMLDHVFNWDFQDEHYNRRRRLTTVLTLACREHDAYCFCTSVKSGPADSRGSDAMLYDLGDGNLEVRLLSEKGRVLLDGKTQPSDATGQAGPGPEADLDLSVLGERLKQAFDEPGFAAWTARCFGCGACAFNCPTCHCFDMVDEGGSAGGWRVRNWDACQFPMFTLHASGHNPRGNQGQRQRQRLYHKFHMYPEKFGTILCTGCGNCTRNCPVSLGVLPVLKHMQKKG